MYITYSLSYTNFRVHLKKLIPSLTANIWTPNFIFHSEPNPAIYTQIIENEKSCNNSRSIYERIVTFGTFTATFITQIDTQKF